jgi:hypothetical protein
MSGIDGLIPFLSFLEEESRWQHPAGILADGSIAFAPFPGFPSGSGFRLANHSGGSARDSHPLPLAATIEVTAHGVVDVGAHDSIPMESVKKRVTEAMDVRVACGITYAEVAASRQSHSGGTDDTKGNGSFHARVVSSPYLRRAVGRSPRTLAKGRDRYAGAGCVARRAIEVGKDGTGGESNRS